MTFPDVLTMVYNRKLTGQMLLHVAEGHVVAVDIPKEPERIRIETRKPVDKPEHCRQT